ncbi:MAG TPA: plasmid pRiA4b ORF-3 family protein [Anaerolineales bacterium]|nr:plasmid pRiA4b ORF-3 family protein [Anaerolineales bacterium]
MTIFQLKIALYQCRPLPTRTVLVAADSTLADLHLVIQSVFDWEEEHLHHFDIDKRRYTDDLEEFSPHGVPMLDESQFTLGELLKVGQEFEYIYDYGDDWKHRIYVEKILPKQPKGVSQLPWCIAAEYAAPSENVGGYPAWNQSVLDYKNPKAEYYEYAQQFLDDSFDVNRVDLEDINGYLEYRFSDAYDEDEFVDDVSSTVKDEWIAQQLEKKFDLSAFSALPQHQEQWVIYAKKLQGWVLNTETKHYDRMWFLVAMAANGLIGLTPAVSLEEGCEQLLIMAQNDNPVSGIHAIKSRPALIVCSHEALLPALQKLLQGTQTMISATSLPKALTKGLDEMAQTVTMMSSGLFNPDHPIAGISHLRYVNDKLFSHFVERAYHFCQKVEWVDFFDTHFFPFLFNEKLNYLVLSQEDSKPISFNILASEEQLMKILNPLYIDGEWQVRDSMEFAFSDERYVGCADSDRIEELGLPLIDSQEPYPSIINLVNNELAFPTKEQVLVVAAVLQSFPRVCENLMSENRKVTTIKLDKPLTGNITYQLPIPITDYLPTTGTNEA